jgi:hypothetical protein
VTQTTSCDRHVSLPCKVDILRRSAREELSRLPRPSATAFHARSSSFGGYAYASVAEAKAGIGSWLGFYNEERQHQSLGYRMPRRAYEAECPWICGRSASPTGCAFAHIPTGTTANYRIDIDEGKDRSSGVPSAIGAGTEIGRATP